MKPHLCKLTEFLLINQVKVKKKNKPYTQLYNVCVCVLEEKYDMMINPQN